MIQFNIPRNSFSQATKGETGRAGETLAVKFLEQKGFRLIKRNHRIRGGELDLIMENDDIMIFVEVKTRTTANFGEPEDSLTPVQTRKIIRAILHWLGENPAKKPWRCDLVGIRFVSPLRANIKHIPNILLI